MGLFWRGGYGLGRKGHFWGARKKRKTAVFIVSWYFEGGVWNHWGTLVSQPGSCCHLTRRSDSDVTQKWCMGAKELFLAFERFGVFESSF